MKTPVMEAEERVSLGREIRTQSFRDPGGSLLLIDDRVVRIVNERGIADLDALLGSRAVSEFCDAGRFVGSRVLDGTEAHALSGDCALEDKFQALGGRKLVEHERIPFASFPYEWPPEMLHAAAKLTLELALSLLPEGLGLKDGTPYNVLFRGPEPVFIDALSVEKRDPADPTWLPYAQFVRTFLLPLLAHQHFGVGPDQTLATRRDGLEPDEVYRWAGPLRRLAPSFLGLVSMPVWLGSRQDPDDTAPYQSRSVGDPEKARFILRSLLKRLLRTLNHLAPAETKHTVWSDYMTSGHSYLPEELSSKQAFTEQVMQDFSPRTVLDVGCNTGHFSTIAARNGARVVAVDYDPAVVGKLWRSARAERLNILPLVVNLTRPTPAIGWRNQECPSFLDRARGSFDAVFMLAVIHHMLVSERVPLTEVIDLAAELTRDLAIIEFVGRDDPMFRRLTRGRDELHHDLTLEQFQTACATRFDILRMQRLGEKSRWLFLLRKK